MASPLVITLAVLGVSILLFLSDRLRPDLIALLITTTLGISGVLTQQEAFSGFARSAVIMLIAIFILTEGLARSGVTDKIGTLLLGITGTDEVRMLTVVMLASATLSLFMNNIAAASVLMPAVIGAARQARVSTSRLLMPMAFATILGGMATLLTTTNIIVSSILRDQGLPGFGLLSFAPLGVPIVAVGVLYMVLWGRHRLPSHTEERQQTIRAAEADLVGLYHLNERLFRARVPSGSALTGKTLAASGLRERFSLTVLAIERGHHVTHSPDPQTQLQDQDVILFRGNLEEFREQDVQPYLEIMPAREWHESDLESPGIVVVEAMLSPRSALISQTVSSSRFRARYNMNVLAIWRAGQQILSHLRGTPLQFGDALLLQGPREQLRVLKNEPDLILLAEPELVGAPPIRGRRRISLGILVGTLVAAALNPDIVGEIMLSGALVMLLSGALTMDQAYGAIDWKSVFLVAGILPLGTAMTKTGAAQMLASALIGSVGQAGPFWLMVALVLVAMLLTQTMNGGAVAAIMAPIAIQAAHSVGADPRSLAMAVLLATNMAFVTPLGHNVNILVMGQGGYTFRDYRRVGLPLTVMLLAVILGLLPLIWPLR